MERTSVVKGGDKLEVWQIEDNGDGVSTEVDVLRVNVDQYFLPSSNFLVYQIKGSLQARVNSFTLPVVQNGKLAGLLLSYNSKEQTANILPMPIIEAFLVDVADGDYQGFPMLGVGIAQTLDEQLRAFSGISSEDGGIFVRKIAKGSSADHGGIEIGDVILNINGKPIDARGNYTDPTYGKLSFNHLVGGNAKVGSIVKIELIREGKLKTLEFPLKRQDATEYLIDPYMFDRGPKFIILGGLIFQELTTPYLQSWGESWTERAPFKLVYANSNPEKYENEGKEKLVFLSNVIKTPSSLGYEGINSVAITKVNGKSVSNIKELSDLLNHVPEDGIHKIEFDDFPKIIFVRDDISREINKQLLQYGIGQLERLQ
jgi:PDZ domain